MGIKVTIVLCCVALTLSVKESSGTKCYVCTSCNDPFNKNAQAMTPQDCPNQSCMKTKADGQVIRSCGTSKMSDGCKDGTVLGQSVNICFCNSDLCNSATTSTISVTAALALVAGVFVYRHIL